MTNEKLFELLKKETNMAESDIMKHIEGMNDEEDIPEMWDGLDIVGDYRMDFAS